ncbi:MAG: MBOAT family O-acyltransferase, partial [Oscillospiraceae bacterium]
KYEGLSIILATLLFTVQIYCDFSGYSDIAIGSAKILGFDLMENFKSPYFAKSIKEFWRRWHISLSTWFSDYVYIPLGGSRVKKSRHIFNLLFTFFLSGFWHGAEYNFAVWGIYHGILLVCESFYINKLDNYANHSSIIKRRCINIVRTVSTFLLVNIGWMIFRANKMGDLRYIFSKVFKMDISTNLTTALRGIGLTNISFCTVLILVLVLTIYDWYAYYRQNPIEFIKKQRPTVRYTVYYIFALWTLIGLLSVPMGTTASFIYFQF